MGAKQKQSGFTIVELLIVIVVIGILAAITIVAYNGIQSRSYNAAVQADMRNIANQIEQYRSINGVYPGSADLASMGIKASKNAYLLTTPRPFAYCAVPSGAASGFGIGGVSKGDRGFYYSSTQGMKERTTWNSSSGITICSAFGVDTADAGFIYVWGYFNDAWSAWVN